MSAGERGVTATAPPIAGMSAGERGAMVTASPNRGCER